MVFLCICHAGEEGARLSPVLGMLTLHPVHQARPHPQRNRRKPARVVVESGQPALPKRKPTSGRLTILAGRTAHPATWGPPAHRATRRACGGLHGTCGARIRKGSACHATTT